MPPQRLLSFEDAATYLGITVKALRHRVDRREIPFVRIGEGTRGRIMFDLRRLDQWIEARTVEAS